MPDAKREPVPGAAGPPDFAALLKRAEALVSRAGESFRVAKGAPQVMLELCQADQALRERVSRAVDELAHEGFRALGVAREEGGRWHYLGLLSLLDPPRPDSARVIENAKAYGIDVRMVTGDHEAIARQVAGQVGLGQNIEEAGDWLRSDDPRQVERAMASWSPVTMRTSMP